MSDETTLLPCPFCGGEAKTHETTDGWIVACSSEQSELDVHTWSMRSYGTTEAEAIEAWNTCACDQREGGAVPMTEEAMAAHGLVRERTCREGGGAMSGNLTAEQVCKAIYNSSDYTTYDGARFHASGINMQTIANELNAALSGGWCKCVWNEQEGTFHCSYCDTLLTSEVSIEWPSHKVTPITLPNFCPNCGRRVIDDRQGD